MMIAPRLQALPQWLQLWLFAALLSALPPAYSLYIPLGTFFGAPQTNATYDYVIVGGGTSGLTVAKRLAEAGYTAAVVEAGSFYELDNSNTSQIPAFSITGTTGSVTDIQPLVDWGFITAPQAGLGNRLVHYAQGKTLGGGSSRNVLAYQRGTKGSYQRWAAAVQDQSFTFENLLKYFEKSPTFTPPNPAYRKDNISYDPSVFSSSGGPLQVSYFNYEQPFTSFIYKAFQKIGLSAIPGFNSGNLIGFAYFAATLDPSKQIRSSAEASFLQAAIAQNNPVTTYTHTTAKKILFGQNKTATGVLVNTAGAGGDYQLMAAKEVILAAGVFKTPQLLMLSGIGPSPTLKQFNIPLVEALEGVGQGIWDHFYYGIQYPVNVTTDSAFANPQYLYQANDQFRNNAAGPLTNIGADLLGWSKVPDKYRQNFSASTKQALSYFPADWPELEILPIAANALPVNDTRNYASITIAGPAPISRGNVTIRSTSVFDQPVINPNWLVATADQEVAIAGVRVARDLIAASGIATGPENQPGPQAQSDAQILEFLKQTAYTLHHAIGSCKMGLHNDTSAVVSTTGRVFGINSLRIVDASTFPVLPPGHPQSSVYMLAEKYANNILSGL